MCNRFNLDFRERKEKFVGEIYDSVYNDQFFIVWVNIYEFDKRFPVNNMHLLIVLVLIAVVCDAQYSDGRSIMVSVRYDCQQKGDSSTHCCSGIILTESYVLTAAECVDHSTDDITVVAGFHNRSRSDQIIRKIDQITIHPQWTIDRVSFKYNIALLHLSNPFNFTIDRHITRACGAVNLKSPNSTRLVVIQWNSIQQNFDATTYVNLQQNEMILAEKNDPICHRLIDDVEQQFCIRFNRPSNDFF